jgi:hypothetical protein
VALVLGPGSKTRCWRAPLEWQWQWQEGGSQRTGLVEPAGGWRLRSEVENMLNIEEHQGTEIVWCYVFVRVQAGALALGRFVSRDTALGSRRARK